MLALVEVTDVGVHGPATERDKARGFFRDLSPCSYVTEIGPFS